MSAELFRKWASKVHLVNAYGPSEASVTSVAN